MPVRVLLVDDHTLVRAGLRSLLDSLDGVEVVAEGGDGREALELTATHQPDVVLMDVSMRELNGLEATERITREHPGTRVIIISMTANEEYVAQAIRNGAVGYLRKDAEAAELAMAIRAAMRGDTYLSPAAARHATALARRQVAPDERLTPRQREVLQLLAEGCTTKDIARKLDLSVRTVETHRTQLMERLEIRDLAGLVRYAIRIGLISPDA